MPIILKNFDFRSHFRLAGISLSRSERRRDSNPCPVIQWSNALPVHQTNLTYRFQFVLTCLKSSFDLNLDQTETFSAFDAVSELTASVILAPV